MSAQEMLTKTVEAFNQHDADGFAGLYAADAIAYDPQYAEPLHGRDAIRKDVEDFFRTFPDVKATISNILANGETAACEMELRGTNTGPLVTPAGSLPPTNRGVKLPGSRFIQLDEQGHIVECRRYFDMGGLVQQLGLQ